MATPQNCDSLIADLDISKLLELIRVAETAERYEDMCKFVEKLVKMKSEKGEDLDTDERNLLSVAHKNVVGAKRASWRTLAGGFDDADEELLKKYKAIVEDELEAICMEVLDLLTEHLCKNVKGNGDETEVFYLKMCGDYYRYLSEFKTEPEDEAKVIKSKAEEFYKQAMNLAEANLRPCHPTRLGVALNFSVCYHEILKEPVKACDLANKSFHDALDDMGCFMRTPRDIELQMQLLRDNVTLWTSHQEDDEQ